MLPPLTRVTLVEYHIHSTRFYANTKAAHNATHGVTLSTLEGPPGPSRSLYIPACDYPYMNAILGRSVCVYVAPGVRRARCSRVSFGEGISALHHSLPYLHRFCGRPSISRWHICYSCPACNSLPASAVTTIFQKVAMLDSGSASLLDLSRLIVRIPQASYRYPSEGSLSHAALREGGAEAS